MRLGKINNEDRRAEESGHRNGDKVSSGGRTTLLAIGGKEESGCECGQVYICPKNS